MEIKKKYIRLGEKKKRLEYRNNKLSNSPGRLSPLFSSVQPVEGKKKLNTETRSPLGIVIKAMVI